jgi:nucleotide-binding universal stress UspA family protein
MIFDRVLCGVDGSEASLIGVRQAARLAAPEGRLLLRSVCDTDIAIHGGWAATAVEQGLRAEAREAVESARRAVGDSRLADARVLEGPVVETLLLEAKREGATLVCLGAHDRRRALGIVLGSVVTTVLHRAPCSVLVARPVPDPDRFPSAIVVGVDGSPEAAAAAAAAAELETRFDVRVHVVVAKTDNRIDVDAIAAEHPAAELVEADPVSALVAAAEHADLLVVGSRGLHGVRALGSVSERVAHKARCSVLVVHRL